jgi:hypothetical protein
MSSGEFLAFIGKYLTYCTSLRQVQHILKHPVWLSQHQLPESSYSKEISRELVKKLLFEAVGQNNLSEF